MVHIEGMTCSSCVNNIETNLIKMPGVLEAHVKLVSEEGLCVFDSRVTNQLEVLGKIEDLGFDATVVDQFILPANYCADTFIEKLQEESAVNLIDSKCQADLNAKVNESFFCLISNNCI